MAVNNRRITKSNKGRRPCAGKNRRKTKNIRTPR
jgi:hypothetical protein